MRREYPEYEEDFVINDIRFWVWAFDQFVGDIRDIVPKPRNLPKQYDLDSLNIFLQEEFLADAEYQRYWWLYYDRAAEALPLLESDGPEHYQYPIEGFHQHMDLEKVRESKDEEAYINLVGSNVDRKLGDLSGFEPAFHAEPMVPEHAVQIEALNHWVKHIKDNNNFETAFEALKFDMITIGSGVMQIGHGVNYKASELAMLKNFIRRKQALTYNEFQRFQDVFNYHKINHIPSFNVVRFRGASGAKSKSLLHPCHRQITWFEHLGAADVRNRYPDYAHKILPGVEQKALELSPELSYLQDDINDMTTLIHHQIRFPVRETIKLPLLQGDGQVFHYEHEQPRYAIGTITRASNGGIVDMKLDYYNHGNYDLTQIVNYPSSKHSCGIGMIKFGRDPALVHNKLHNGALRYFGAQVKGGGFYADGIVDDDDMKSRSLGNRWIKIDLQKARNFTNRNQNLKLGDFIMDNRPPAFPTAWAQLMNMESEALDRSMRSGSAWRGERTGYSGLQQSIATQDASMQHVGTHQELKNGIKEMADITFSNVIQFDGDRYIQFTREDENGDLTNYELNKEMFPHEEFDPEFGIYKVVPTYIANHVGSMNFVTKIQPESIVPRRPIEKVNFFIQMLQFLYPYTQDPYGRQLLRGFQTEGLRIPSLRNSMDIIDQMDAERMQMQGQIQEMQQEYERLQDDREWSKNKAEITQNLLRLVKKFITDLTKANPDTLQMLFGNRQSEVTQRFVNALMGSLTGDSMPGGNLPTIPGMPTPQSQTQAMSEMQQNVNQ